ncbi:MAG TPA: GTPase ObgE [Patescibacteria group bacterium]|nr:GTPase ObgE [Patescibacteria group bacterium]
MLVDIIEVVFKGGHGGRGIVSFGKMARSGPDGGNGGRGGDLFVRATSDITLLNQFNSENFAAAENGQPGGRNKTSGKDGKDLEVLLPVGTSLIDKKSGLTILELKQIDQRELVCRGGLGGKGNWEFRGPKNITPMYAQSGFAGDKKDLILSLRLIADYGFIGLPNAGKTSLLNELTNSKAKTANYAFTTLTPNIGVYNGKYLADIPGLIEGASNGKGLGIKFLKHIEKVDVLLHCIASDSPNPEKDYETVRGELKAYNSELLNKKEIILLTKSDMVEDKKTLKELINRMKLLNKKVMPISIHDFESIEKLKKILK